MTDYDPNGHGTKMLSKIAAVTDDLGPNLGVSRGASIVVVKLPEPIPLRTANGGVAVIQSTVTHAWNLIYDDVVAHGYLFGKAVISLSQGPLLNHAAELDEILMPELDQDDAAGMAYWDDYRIMRRLFDLGVTIVHASGNQGDPDEGRDANYELTDPMDLWGSQYNFPIIVVGAVDNAGVAWEGTQWVPPSPPNPFSGARVHVWAPGVDVLTNGPGSELEQVEGTSVCKFNP
jgi:subtilisin family serine protease